MWTIGSFHFHRNKLKIHLEDKAVQKKIYVAGMDDQSTADKVTEAVKAISGVQNVSSFVEKCQVCVDYNEGEAGIEDNINNAITSNGVVVLG